MKEYNNDFLDRRKIDPDTWCQLQPHRMTNHMVTLGLVAVFASCASADTRYVVQPQDNFDPTNTHTWQQAFFVNDTFWKAGSDAPVFLCVGGEGALHADSVSGSAHCNIAVEWLQETGALMFGLEHRYYGCHNASSCR